MNPYLATGLVVAALCVLVVGVVAYSIFNDGWESDEDEDGQW